MRFGLRAKQIVGVTAVVALAVVMLGAVHVTRLLNLALGESEARADLVAQTIRHHINALVRESGVEPAEAVRGDTGVQSIVQSSIYGRGLDYAAIVDTGNVVVAHSDPREVGRPYQQRVDLQPLIEAPALEQLGLVFFSADGRLSLSAGGQPLELRRDIRLATRAGVEEDFGSIRIGVSTARIGSQLRDWLRPAIWAAIVAMVVAVMVAGVLAQRLLRPIHVIRSGLTRLGQGEFGVTLDLPPGDEFGELGSFFNTVSAQLSADRTHLAGQKANLQWAVEHIEDAVALFNPSGELLFVNPAMQLMLPPGAIGRALEGLLPVGHPFRVLVEETLAARTSRGPVQVSARLAHREDDVAARAAAPAGAQGDAAADRKADGASDLLAVTHAIAGTSGELVGVLLLARDIAYLSRVQSTLAYSRKLVALGRLTAGIAHEVKNPLNAMMIHLELLRTKIQSTAAPRTQAVAAGATLGLGGAHDPPLPPEVESALQHVVVIESEIRRLDEVVQGFLKFTRPEDLRLQPVRLAALVEEILPVVTPEARKHDVRILVDVPADLPAVNGDAAMLRQALLNLAINGCQAMPQGGLLRFTGRVAPQQRVEIRVEDSGVGIPAEHLERIFDLYFTTKPDGTGIGLSMVYRIVQLHDAEIEVESTPGRGTAFRLLMPRAGEM